MTSIINSPKLQKWGNAWRGQGTPTKMAHTGKWMIFQQKQPIVTSRTELGTGDTGLNVTEKPLNSRGSCSNWGERFPMQAQHCWHLGWIILCHGGCSVYHRVCSSVPDLFSLGTSRYPPQLPSYDNPNVPRLSQMSQGGSHPRLSHRECVGQYQGRTEGVHECL